MSTINIRLATPDDALTYHLFMKDIFAENLDTLIPDVSPDVKAASRYIMRHDGIRSALFLADIEGLCVGAANFTSFDRAEKDHTVGVGLYVANGHRGRGVGRRLMEAGVQWGKAAPLVERIELLVMENNAVALRLYDSLGFVHEGTKLCAVKKPYGYINVVVMGLLMKGAANAFHNVGAPST